MEFYNKSIFNLEALNTMIWFSDRTINTGKKKTIKIVCLIVGLLCLGIGYYLRSVVQYTGVWAGIFPGLGGAILIMGLIYQPFMNLLARQQVKRSQQLYQFHFEEESFSAGITKATPYEYASLYALRESDDYFALFLGPRQAFIVDKVGFEGVDDAANFGPFLEAKTGLTIQSH